ncbi:MAG: bifunctional pyr operon transcriptional regulator/uracil phosphoribosyltransferase PyrR [Ginsengibacter sp.]
MNECAYFHFPIAQMNQKNYILDKIIAGKKLQRIAYEIAERNVDVKELILAGVKENGFIIAQKIASLLVGIFDGNVKVISITLDKKHPVNIGVEPQTDVNNKVVILVDDVANSGKTLTYVLKPFLEQFPLKIQTLVLVERTHKTFPIIADYVGLSVATTLQEQIIVEVDKNEVTGAYLI